MNKSDEPFSRKKKFKRRSKSIISENKKSNAEIRKQKNVKYHKMKLFLKYLFIYACGEIER